MGIGAAGHEGHAPCSVNRPLERGGGGFESWRDDTSGAIEDRGEEEPGEVDVVVVIIERQVGVIGGGGIAQWRCADGDRPPGGGKRGGDEAFHEPRLGAGGIMAPKDDEVGPVAEFLPGCRDFAATGDRRSPRMTPVFVGRGERRAERFGHVTGRGHPLDRDLVEPRDEHAAGAAEAPGRRGDRGGHVGRPAVDRRRRARGGGGATERVGTPLAEALEAPLRPMHDAVVAEEGTGRADRRPGGRARRGDRCVRRR